MATPADPVLIVSPLWKIFIRYPWVLFMVSTFSLVRVWVSCRARIPIPSVFSLLLTAVHLCAVSVPAAPLTFSDAILSVARVFFFLLSCLRLCRGMLASWCCLALCEWDGVGGAGVLVGISMSAFTSVSWVKSTSCVADPWLFCSRLVLFICSRCGMD